MKSSPVHYTSNSCLFVGVKGLFRVSCPFEVTCVLAVNKLSAGDKVFVSAVKMSPDGKVVFVIKGEGYYSRYFAYLL